MKKGIKLRKTVKNERFLVRAKVKTTKVGVRDAVQCVREVSYCCCCCG